MTPQLVLRSIGRVLWFAIVGAICTVLIGIFAGAVTGGLMMVPATLSAPRTPGSGPTFVWRDGALYGAAIAAYIGAFAGAFSFAIAGVFACFNPNPRRVFSQALRLSWRAALVFTVAGAILGIVNAFLFGRFIGAFANDPFMGYMYGVIAGFVLGTLYGAIVGARREIARQKQETL